MGIELKMKKKSELYYSDFEMIISKIKRWLISLAVMFYIDN
jgi:hypothetical protein